MARVERTPVAQRSLEEIFDYVGRQRQSPSAAAMLLRRIDEKCRLYSLQPRMGELRPDLGEGVRCFSVGSYVVIYEPLDDGIRVLVVIHGHRDVPAVLRDMFLH